MTFDPDFLGCSSSTDRPVQLADNTVNGSENEGSTEVRMKSEDGLRLPFSRKLVKQDEGRLLTSVGEMR